MYNEEIKNRYIKWKLQRTTMNPSTLPNIFNKTEKFEKELGRDVCNFSTEEDLDMLQTMSSYSFESMSQMISVLKMYTDWCMVQGFVDDYQNHFMVIRPNQIVNVSAIQMRVISPEMLDIMLQQLENPCEQFLLLALYEGIKGQAYSEISQMKRGDIDERNNTINIYKRGVMHYSDRLCTIAIKSAETYVYYPHFITENENAIREVNLIHSDYVYKEKPNCKDNASLFRKGKRIYTQLATIFDDFGMKDYMTPQAILDSGIVNTLIAKCKESGKTLEEILYYTDEVKKLEKKYNRRIIKKNFIQKYSYLL